MMFVRIFRRIRRRRNSVGYENENAAVFNDDTDDTGRFVLKENHRRRSRLQRLRRKQTQLLYRQNQNQNQNQSRDTHLDNHNHDDHTDRESISSNGSGSTTTTNTRNRNRSQRKRRSLKLTCAENRVDTNGYRDDSIGCKVAEIGRPPKRLLQKKERMTFKYHGFAQCNEKRGEYRLTPSLQAHGYNWKLQVYPRGDTRSDQNSEYISCFLHYFTSPNDRQAPAVKVEYCCGGYKTETQICTFSVEKGKCSTSWGLENFLKRQQVIQNCLDMDGALSIDVNIQIAVDRRTMWYPPPMRQEPTLMQLYYLTEETGDIGFRILTSSTSDSKNKIDNPNDNCSSSSISSTSDPYYRAHKMILALRARILYELVCEESCSSDEEDDDREGCEVVFVDLPGVSCDTFEAMMEHIYTVRQPIIDNEEMARNLLVAADRFCLTDLKLYVESVLVDRFVSPGNAAYLLLFADSHSCALLKEATMDLYASDPRSVTQTPGWAMVEESEAILWELSNHVHTGCRQNFHSFDRKKTIDTFEDEEIEIDHGDEVVHTNCTESLLDVFSIRDRLGELGLDVDGSRETLLGRLGTLHEVMESKG